VIEFGAHNRHGILREEENRLTYPFSFSFDVVRAGRFLG
jgi:hypothetical protein